MRFLRILFLVLLVINGLMIIPAIIQVTPETAHDQGIRVMTYNIHQLFVADPDPASEKSGAYVVDTLLDVIRAESPDIIGLQEAEGARLSSGNIQALAYLAEQLEMYYYYAPGVDEQTYGNSILSVWPIIKTEYEILPRPEGIERAVTHAVIDSPFGELRVFNTHFEISRFEVAQKQAAEFLIDYVGTGPAIITGDFNVAAERNQEAYHILNGTFTYAMLLAGIPVNDSRSYTSPVENPNRKIDFIWLSRGDWSVDPSSFKVVGNSQASDHLAVVVTIFPN